MGKISRKLFLTQSGMLSTSLILGQELGFWSKAGFVNASDGVLIEKPLDNEDIFSYIQRIRGKMDVTLYRQIIGAANDFKEGDHTLGLASKNEASRKNARTLLGQTKLADL